MWSDEKKKPYYIHEETNEKKWEHPGYQEGEEGWEEYWSDEHHRLYWFNTVTNKSFWYHSTHEILNLMFCCYLSDCV